MEGNKQGLSYKIKWISNIIKHGLFWHGVRNNMAKIGIDFMPYYYVQEAITPLNEPKLRDDKLQFEILEFGEKEIVEIKNTIIGIEQKDLIHDLKNGEVCIGLKHEDNIAAYMFIKRKPFYFRKKYIKLDSHEAYLHSMYTFENYRGKGVAPFLRYHSYQLMKSKGVTKFYSVSEYFNKSTIKFKKKLNSKHVALFLSIFWFKKWYMNFTLKRMV